MNRILIVLFALLAVYGCKKNDDPTPATSNPTNGTNNPTVATNNPTVTLLTFRQDASTPTTDTDDWIFITDETGTLLDTKQFEADQSVVLTTNKVTANQRINVTIFQSSNNSINRLSFYSLLGISQNQSWTYKKKVNSPTFPPLAGTFTLNVANYPSGFPYFWVTTSQTLLVGSSTVASSQYGLLQTAPTKILVTSYRNNVPVYATFTATPGSTTSLNFSIDMKPTEHILSYDLTGASLFSVDINAFDAANTGGYQGYRFANFSNSTNPTAPGNLVVGWADGFAAYRTQVSAYYPNKSKSYYKFGAGATTTPFLDYTSTVTNADYKNFAFTVSGDYQLRTSHWSAAASTPVITWTIDSPADGNQKFTDIPTELKTKYPILATATLTHTGTDFTKYLDGFTYSDYIMSTMNTSTPAKDFSNEYQKISFY